jgi:hypothetical protein
MEAPMSSQSAVPNPSIALDTEAQACWDLAAWIGAESSDDALRSYTTVLIALLYSPSALSKWLLRYAGAAGVDVTAICGSRQFRPASLPTFKAKEASGEKPAGKTSVTISATNILQAATGLADETDRDQVGIRHLLAAYLYRNPPAHIRQSETWGVNPERDGSAFVRQMRARYPDELSDWTRIHRDALGMEPDLNAADPVEPARVSGFAADTSDGDDLLDIEDDVYALSALLCSTRVRPPLSVGLFGDWGSGKSFFIRQLQKGVSWISEQARTSTSLQKDLPFYKHVVQIEFNAWNYSEGNLWAALVQHILENLRLTKDDPDDLVEGRRQHLQKEMALEQQVRDAAMKRQEEAQSRVNEVTSQLHLLRQKHDEQVEELKASLAEDVLKTVTLDPAVVGQLNEVRTRLGLPQVQASAGEFVAAIEGTQSVLRRASAIFEYVPDSQRARFVRNSVIVLAAPPLAAIGVAALLAKVGASGQSAASLATWLSVTLGAGAGWLRDRTKALNAQIAQLEQLQDHARQRVQAEVQRHKAEVAALEQRIALAKDQILAAQQKQQEAQGRLEQIRAQLDATTPGSVMADFVRERSTSDDYRKYLGLPSIIRRDFDRISRMIDQEYAELAKKTTIEEEQVGTRHRINRIVRYIDDLDRCPEELVVAVLKAVHLLLAFNLFVVVVAVDARWVSRSLAQRFPGLLTPSKEENGNGASQHALVGGTHATPNDYLEKIFQIPLWLQPPSEESVKRMMRSLLGEAQAGGQGAHHGGNGKAEDPAGTAAGNGHAVFQHRTHDPNASMLDIQAEELAFIQTLAPLLDRSPRALKRFVNVYRLLKASLPPAEHDAWTDSHEGLGESYRTVLLLLAIVNGLPAVADVLFGAVLAKANDEPLAPASSTPPAGAAYTLGSIVDGIACDPEMAAAEEKARLERWLTTHVGPEWSSTDASPLLNWVPRVARYSYHLHRTANA